MFLKIVKNLRGYEHLQNYPIFMDAPKELREKHTNNKRFYAVLSGKGNEQLATFTFNGKYSPQDIERIKVVANAELTRFTLYYPTIKEGKPVLPSHKQYMHFGRHIDDDFEVTVKKGKLFESSIKVLIHDPRIFEEETRVIESNPEEDVENCTEIGAGVGMCCSISIRVCCCVGKCLCLILEACEDSKN